MTDCTYNTDMDAWNNVFSTNETASGIEITSTDACFYNQEMSTVQFYIKRTGTSSDLVYCRVYNSSGTLAHTFGSMALSALTTGGRYEEFTSESAYTFSDGDRLVMEFTDGDTNNKLNVRVSSTYTSDTGVQGIRYQGGWYSSTMTQTIISPGSVSSGFVGLPPPPIVVRF